MANCRESRKVECDFGDAVAIRVAQQCDAIRARHGRTRFLHVAVDEPAFDSFVVVWPHWTIRLGHKYIAVG